MSNSGGRGKIAFTAVYGPNTNASRPKMILMRLLHVRVRHIPYACTYGEDGFVERALFPRVGIGNVGLGEEYFEAHTFRRTHGWYVTFDGTINSKNSKLWGTVAARSPDDPSDECSSFFLDDYLTFTARIRPPKG